jgi:hypothetical protein
MLCVVVMVAAAVWADVCCIVLPPCSAGAVLPALYSCTACTLQRSSRACWLVKDTHLTPPFCGPSVLPPCAAPLYCPLVLQVLYRLYLAEKLKEPFRKGSWRPDAAVMAACDAARLEAQQVCGYVCVCVRGGGCIGSLGAWGEGWGEDGSVWGHT